MMVTDVRLEQSINIPLISFTLDGEKWLRFMVVKLEQPLNILLMSVTL